MPKREKILLCIGAVFLVLLFLLSSTDLIIKERAVQDPLHFCDLK